METGLWAKSAMAVVLILSLVSCGYSVGGKLTASGDGTAAAPSSKSPCPKDTSDPIVVEWIKKGICVTQGFEDAAEGTNEFLIKWQRFFDLIRNFFQ